MISYRILSCFVRSDEFVPRLFGSDFLELVERGLYSGNNQVSFRCQPLPTFQNSWVSLAIRGMTTAIVREVSRFLGDAYKASYAANWDDPRRRFGSSRMLKQFRPEPCGKAKSPVQ
jgi:hypothetical protein